MSESEDETEENAGKQKSGEGEAAGAAGAQGVMVSQGFYEKMGLLGASSALIAEILQTWRHLEGQSLLQQIKAFASARSRVSAHAEVDIRKGKDYGLIHNFFQSIQKLSHTLTHKRPLGPHNTPGPQ